MKKALWMSVFSMGLLLRWTCGQTPEPAKNALPSGPLIISQMPDRAQWTVDYVYSDTPKPGEASRLDKYKQAALKDPALAKAMQDPNFLFSIQNIRPLHILITKTGKIQHEERTLEQGLQSEMWSKGDIEVERTPNIPRLVARNMAGLEGDAFPEFDWISKDNFIGIQTHNDIKCLAFKQDVFNADHQLIGTKNAFVDLKTHYPVAYQFGVESSQYTILPPPSAELEVPEDFLAAGRELTERIEKATPHLAPP